MNYWLWIIQWSPRIWLSVWILAKIFPAFGDFMGYYCLSSYPPKVTVLHPCGNYSQYRMVVNTWFFKPCNNLDVCSTFFYNCIALNFVCLFHIGIKIYEDRPKMTRSYIYVRLINYLNIFINIKVYSIKTLISIKVYI